VFSGHHAAKALRVADVDLDIRIDLETTVLSPFGFLILAQRMAQILRAL
jgi:hypothetical protein